MIAAKLRIPQGKKRVKKLKNRLVTPLVFLFNDEICVCKQTESKRSIFKRIYRNAYICITTDIIKQ